MPASDEQKLPSSIEAEHALLGILLFENSAFAALADHPISKVHFHEPFHQRMFGVMKVLVAADRLVEPILLMERFKRDPAFDELGGLHYLSDLVDRAPPPSAVKAYADIVYDLALRRLIIQASRDMAAAAHDETTPALDVINKIEREVVDLARGAAPSETNLVDARTSVLQTLDEIDDEAENGKSKGKMTGLRCIDRRLGGIRPGHLIVIGGRPSMGKTALARAAASGCASRNPGDLVAYFALEMDRRELDERALSEISYLSGNGVPYQEMSSGKLDPMTRRQLREDAWKVPKNFIIDDSPSLTLEHVQRRVWALKRRGKLVACFIDYLQIMDLPERNGRNDAALYGALTKGLKNLARAAEIGVVLLSQVNRGVEGREDKRPALSDLRESGSIEQDANAVLFPFREGYYLERAEPKEGSTEHLTWQDEVEKLRRRMDVICAKNRGGAIGMDRQEYLAEFDVIRDLHGEAS